MTKAQFKQFIDEMIDIYGVGSYKLNITPDMTQEDIDRDLWFEAPCCYDIIYYEDVDEKWEKMLNDGICPICGEYFEEDC